jgi:hypothetical protein
VYQVLETSALPFAQAALEALHTPQLAGQSNLSYHRDFCWKVTAHHSRIHRQPHRQI